VLPSAVAALGVDGWQNTLELPPADSYVVLLVDGMGWNLLRRHAEEAPYLSTLATRRTPLTSGVPSTTASSIASLGTGRPTGSHGLVGYTCRIPGTRRVLDALRWDPRVDAREWQPHETVFGLAARDGVAAGVVSKGRFELSGLTLSSQRGASYVPAESAGERISATVRVAGVPRSLTYVYDGDLDATGHSHGCTSWDWRYQLAMVDRFAETLREALPARVALVVTADHGMVDVPAAGRIDADDEPDLLAGVSLLAGEARFRHLYCDAGAVAGVVARWRERLGEAAVVVTRDEAIDLGWFGSVETPVRPRLGDVMVASIGPAAVMASGRFPHEVSLVGLHGSLSAEEMLVPLLVDSGG
jgi:predicted AlkP superfamily pyrophosphatase or phosphodiesterase